MRYNRIISYGRGTLPQLIEKCLMKRNFVFLEQEELMISLLRQYYLSFPKARSIRGLIAWLKIMLFWVFSADKWNVYKAELEHDFSADKDKLEICSNYVTDGNEHHGIGSAGVQKIISLARMLKCKEIWGKAESYLDETEEGKERLRNFYKKKGFVFEENNDYFSMKL